MVWANDNFANAASISGTSGTTGLGTWQDGASFETGEPASGYQTPRPTIWYSWVAPSSGYFYFNTDGSPSSPASASGLDTILCVFTASATPAAFSNLVLVAANDDATGASGYYYNSQVRLNATAGVTYYIQVSSYAGTNYNGQIQLSWLAAPPPPPAPANDRLANAQVIPYGSGFGVVTGTTLGASITSDEPNYSAGQVGYQQSVWYVVTGVPVGAFYLEITSSNHVYTEISAYNGPISNITPTSKYEVDADTYGPHGGTHKGSSTVVIMVTTYEIDPGGSNFTFGWGCSGDTDPSHWSPWIYFDWQTWDSRVTKGIAPGATTTNSLYPDPSACASEGLDSSQFSLNYDAVTPTPFSSNPIPPDNTQETCAWDNACYGQLGSYGNCPGFLGLAPGTHNNSGLDHRPDSTGYRASHSSGGFFTSGYNSTYECSICSGFVNLQGPLTYEAPVPYTYLSDLNAWGMEYEDKSVDATLAGNQIRNLEFDYTTQDPWAGYYSTTNNVLMGATGWTIDVLALKLSDQQTYNSTAPDVANEWYQSTSGTYYGPETNWQDPTRTDQVVLGVLSDTNQSNVVLQVASPSPLLVSQNQPGSTAVPLQLAYYFRSSLLAVSSIPQAVDIGNYYAERTFASTYAKVDFKWQGYRAYLGFPLTVTGGWILGKIEVH